MVLSLVACSGSDDATPTVDPGPTPTALQALTSTPFPTITPSTGRPTATLTPFPTLAPPPTPTSTPRPRPTPTPIPLTLTESYEHDHLSYSLRYPVGWEVSAEGPLTVVIAQPIGTNRARRAMLVTGEIRGSITLDEYLERALSDQARRAMGNGMGDFREMSRSRIAYPPSYLVKGEYSTEGGGFLATMLVTINDSSALFAVGMVRESLRDLHQPILAAMLGSIAPIAPTIAPIAPTIAPIAPTIAPIAPTIAPIAPTIAPTIAPEGPPIDDHSDNPARATEITVGETASGVIGEADDEDYFRFQAVVDTTYRIDVDLRTPGDSLVLLYSNGGDCLITLNDDRDEGLASTIQWTVALDEELHVLVANAEVLGAYSYTLTVDIVSGDSRTDEYGSWPCSSTAISVGVPVTGAIDYPADGDWFGFEVEEGVTYTLEVTLGTLDDSLLRLYDPGAQVLLEQNDDFGESLASRIVWRAPRTGTVSVGVESAVWGDLGTYTLTIT
jgi:hypothetical protein